MDISKRSPIVVAIIIFSLLHGVDIQAATFSGPNGFSFEEFNPSEGKDPLKFLGNSSPTNGALQLTPDTRQDISNLHDKSGRIMYSKSFKLWAADDVQASFSSSFVINIFKEPSWITGQGLAFLIAPNKTIPEASFGPWLGLTNATTDGSHDNQIVAIEFDTLKQDYDPDSNHLGLNINSVVSNKTIPLKDHNIDLSPEEATNYSVWVHYSGTAKRMEVYMVKEGEPKPEKPLLNETINLKEHVSQRSYFGFAASTGNPEVQLNCVLKWSLEIQNIEKKWEWWKMSLVIGVPGVILLVLVLCGVLYLKKRRRRSDEESNVFDASLRWLPEMPKEFKYKDLKKATDNFHERMRLGQGGFGIVYKGILNIKNDESATEVAVKQFSRDKIQSKDDFLAELTIIHRLRHKHLVRLIGWCYDNWKLLLVYDFMPNGSLDNHLYGASDQTTLSWERRHRILAGVASALHYLHNQFDQKVVHRDLKASNILLDSDYNARVSDFGLARALDNGRNSYAEQELAGVPGTMGYVAPECFHTGRATPESDVFSFGAVVLEVVCGRSPGISIKHHQHLYSLVDWVWMLHREGNVLDAVDKRLRNDYVVDEAKRLLLLGLACSHPIAGERPQAEAICQIISGTLSVPYVPPFKPVFTWPLVESTFLSATLASKDSCLTNSHGEQ